MTIKIDAIQKDLFKDVVFKLENEIHISSVLQFSPSQLDEYKIIAHLHDLFIEQLNREQISMLTSFENVKK